MKKYLFWFGVFAPVLGVVLASMRVYYCAAIWQYTGPDTNFIIKSGEAFSSINYRLDKEGLIYSSKLFFRYAKVNNLITKFKSGTFRIYHNSTMLVVIDSLIKGKSLDKSVTIPEGKNIYEIGHILEEQNICDYEAFIAKARDPELLKILSIKGVSVEGYLYPDTYDFPPGTTAEQIIHIMVNNFHSKIKSLDLTTSPFDSIEQLITMASMVEKETGAPIERPMIAQVFLNRLKKKMRLQSDPTTIYGMFESYGGNLKKEDLLKETPFNTYKIPALPLGPIANPGIDAIRAVLNPTPHNYLYFVSHNDGTHAFSASYEEHQKAVQKYQVSKEFREGHSWRELAEKESQKKKPHN